MLRDRRRLPLALALAKERAFRWGRPFHPARYLTSRDEREKVARLPFLAGVIKAAFCARRMSSARSQSAGSILMNKLFPGPMDGGDDDNEKRETSRNLKSSAARSGLFIFFSSVVSIIKKIGRARSPLSARRVQSSYRSRASVIFSREKFKAPGRETKPGLSLLFPRLPNVTSSLLCNERCVRNFALLTFGSLAQNADFDR